MMNKFKVGDNVIINRQVVNVPKGTRGVVIESPAHYWSKKEGFSVRFENFKLGHSAGHDNGATDCWNFFATESYKLDKLVFKAGDHVRLKPPLKYGEFWNTTLVVIKVGNIDPYHPSYNASYVEAQKIDLFRKSKNDGIGGFTVDELEHYMEKKTVSNEKRYIVKAEDACVYDDIEKAQKTAEYLNKNRDGRKFYVVEVSNTYKRKEKLVKTIAWEKE